MPCAENFSQKNSVCDRSHTLISFPEVAESLLVQPQGNTDVPRYYFHLYNNVVIRDEEGDELPDLEAARAEALEAARGMICHSVKGGKLNLSHRVDVHDDKGKQLFTLPFRNAITICE